MRSGKLPPHMIGTPIIPDLWLLPAALVRHNIASSIVAPSAAVITAGSIARPEDWTGFRTGSDEAPQ